MMPKHALIVDDSQLAQFVLKKMLQEEAITAECSGSAEEALEYLKINKPDIIFLDHTMPGMNGLEVLKLLKKDTETRDIPVMMYTSQEDKRYTEKAIALGAIEVLPKQLKRPDLHRILITLDDENAAVALAQHNEDKDLLEQIVYDAEEALKHETWQQRFKHAFEEHRETSNEKIQQLNERIDRLMLHQDQQPHKRQLFWNNLFWMLLFCIALGIFIFIYMQQQHALDTLQQQNSNIPASSTQQQNTLLNDSANNNGNSTQTGETLLINGEDNNLQELENYFNSNRIAFGELLLGTTTLAMLEEIDDILSAEAFKGLVVITPLESVFCVSTNSQGQPTLLDAAAPISQCQFTQVNTQLTANINVEVQQFINTQNTINQDYQYIITAIENNQRDLPATDEETNAENWNSIAASNRRIQFEFQPAF